MLVWDVERGNLLKLVEGKLVARAFHGTTRLSKEEIGSAYGEPPQFAPVDFPLVTRQQDCEKNAFMVLSTYFDCCRVPLIAHAIDLIDQGTLPVSYLQFSLDLRDSILRLYAHYDAKCVHSIQKFGTFFPELVRDPHRYIQAQPELRTTLESLRSGGTRLFLATNSHAETMELILRATLGQDWQSLFDFACAHCCKPSFFQKQNPFFTVDEEALNLKGTSISEASQLALGMRLLEGNSRLLS